jgi:hypothetical protein
MRDLAWAPADHPSRASFPGLTPVSLYLYTQVTALRLSLPLMIRFLQERLSRARI